MIENRRLFFIYDKLAALSRKKYNSLIKKDIDGVAVLNKMISDLLSELNSPEYGDIILAMDETDKAKLYKYVKKLKKYNERNKVIIENSLNFIQYIFESLSGVHKDKGTYDFTGPTNSIMSFQA